MIAIYAKHSSSKKSNIKNLNGPSFKMKFKSLSGNSAAVKINPKVQW